MVVFVLLDKGPAVHVRNSGKETEGFGPPVISRRTYGCLYILGEKLLHGVWVGKYQTRRNLFVVRGGGGY